MAGQALVEVYRHRGEGEFTARRPFRYRVINPLDHPVRAAVQLPIDYWEDGVVAGGVRVVTPSGVALPAQMEPAPRGRVIVTVVELGPKGETVLQVEPAATSSPREGGTDGFSNAFYRAAWTAQRGLYSLVEATTGMELFGGEPGGAGCPVYQIFPQGNRGSAAGFGYKPRTIPRAETTVGHCVEAKRTRSGDLFERWEFRYQVAGTTSYVLAATFYRDLPFLEFAARVVKTDVMDPEGLYVAFPFAVDGGVWHLDKPGGPIRPGLDQLPGSCCDYYCIQTGAAIAGPKLGLAWTTLDAPLIHVGKIRLWDYSTAIQPIGPVYSWLTNNKWDTNFKLTCGGRFEFRYVVEVSPRFTDPAAALAACQTHTYPPVVLRY